MKILKEMILIFIALILMKYLLDWSGRYVIEIIKSTQVLPTKDVSEYFMKHSGDIALRPTGLFPIIPWLYISFVLIGLSRFRSIVDDKFRTFNVLFGCFLMIALTVMGGLVTSFLFGIGLSKTMFLVIGPTVLLTTLLFIRKVVPKIRMFGLLLLFGFGVVKVYDFQNRKLPALLESISKIGFQPEVYKHMVRTQVSISQIELDAISASKSPYYSGKKLVAATPGYNGYIPCIIELQDTVWIRKDCPANVKAEIIRKKEQE